jgi:O-acetylhomoserine (thiol)-lyase
MAEQLRFDTLKVRASYRSVAVTSFELGDVARARRLNSFAEIGFAYSRVSKPTTDVLEQRITALDGAAATDLIADLEQAFAKAQCACCS